MAIQLSPGVNVSEIDLTTVVPAVATTDGAIGGLFRWGPVGQRVLVDSENILVSHFGKPTSYNAETFFTAANFLSYTNRLYVSRGANTTGITPYQTFGATEGNNVFLCSNTAGLEEGMYVTQTTASDVVTSTGKLVKITSVNSTAIVLSTNAAASNASFDLYFGRPETSYSALAVDVVPVEDGIVANLVNQIVRNDNEYINKFGANNTLNFDPDVAYVAKYPGDMGNSLRVSVCDSVNAFNSSIDMIDTFNTTIKYSIGSNVAVVEFSGAGNTSVTSNWFSIGDKFLVGNASIGYQYLQVTGSSINTNYQPAGYSTANTVQFIEFQDPYRLHTPVNSNTVNRYWEFHNVVDSVPGTSPFVTNYGNSSAVDELHVVVVDDGGLFTGTPGTILEVYKGLSRATDAKNTDSTVNYYKDVINQNSKYIWWANDRSEALSATALNVVSSSAIRPANMKFRLGADGYDESTSTNFSVIASAYDLFASAEDVDVSLILQGRPFGGAGASYQLANYIIDNLCSTRKDCVAFISPDKDLVLNNFGTESTDVIAWRNNVHSSSYAVMDSGYKYQYDRYNDVYRWIPLNGDIAGLCARTDQTNDAWWSPAGFNRGQIKNLVKLAWNPRKAERDVLYVNGINSVVAFPGQGTVLYGDKTLQSKPSAFDRINVRRLFIVLEKAISRASKYSLFEFNDAFTRAQFKNLITPYLRTVQGRRGITDFYVVCDDTNNTADIIDTNQFVGDIYVKPARSINFIQLNFVAVGTGVQFSEVVGRF